MKMHRMPPPCVTQVFEPRIGAVEDQPAPLVLTVVVERDLNGLIGVATITVEGDAAVEGTFGATEH